MTGPNCGELSSVDAQETSSDIVEEHIVGRTEGKRKIMDSLLEVMSEKIVMIILPIHGIGGIGKTTFARLIYNDPMFELYSKVWIYVSQRFDLNKICESIISQLSERQNLHSYLASGKKILIVLDDLWEDNQIQLQELKDMLYDKFHNESGIIILVTTRSESVAERICTNIQPYKIPPLSKDMCWYIIKQRSYFEARDDSKQWTDIGLEIAQKCGGVALAAQSLGFTLRSMNFDQWVQVRDSDIWNGTISDHVLASLKLSHHYMPSYLKPCFNYCAIFPK
ncbi:putative disease resistance protein RGA1, partial [Dichanthelium oligosanthes]